MDPELTVTISDSEYCWLLRSAKLLEALEAGGVDNWEGYWEATRKFYSDDEEEDF